jgi:Tfp pilus assembly protein PilX
MALMSGAVLGLWRSAITREALSNADADRFQARQAARALVREAQRDILSSTPSSRHAPGPDGSPDAFYPRDALAWQSLLTRLQRPSGLPCLQGICLALPVSETPLSTWVARLPQAAVTGQFAPRLNPSDTGNALAQLYPGTAAYWVELLPFDTESRATSSRIDVVYRITAYAQGRLPGTRVLQQVLWLANTHAPERAQAPRLLQWREWLE